MITLSLKISKDTKRETYNRKMSKIMQKFLFFIDPTEHGFETPLKIGNLFMNRFAVDEVAASEILKNFELENYYH